MGHSEKLYIKVQPKPLGKKKKVRKITNTCTGRGLCNRSLEIRSQQLLVSPGDRMQGSLLEGDPAPKDFPVLQPLPGPQPGMLRYVTYCTRYDYI